MQMSTWYDMGSYYFKLYPDYDSAVYTDYDGNLKERYPDAQIFGAGCPTKWGNFAVVYATYPLQGEYVFNN